MNIYFYFFSLRIREKYTVNKISYRKEERNKTTAEEQFSMTSQTVRKIEGRKNQFSVHWPTVGLGYCNCKEGNM